MAFRFPTPGQYPTGGIVGAIIADPTDKATPFRYWPYNLMEKIETEPGSVLPNGMPATTARAIALFDWDAVGGDVFRTIPWGLLNPVDGKPKEFYFMYKVKYGATTEYVEFLCREMNKVAEAVLERDTFEKAFPIFLNSCPGHTINPKRHVALGTEPERMITQDDYKKLFEAHRKANAAAKFAGPPPPPYRPLTSRYKPIPPRRS